MNMDAPLTFVVEFEYDIELGCPVCCVTLNICHDMHVSGSVHSLIITVEHQDKPATKWGVWAAAEGMLESPRAVTRYFPTICCVSGTLRESTY